MRRASLFDELCLEPVKIEALKMLDSQTKSAHFVLDLVDQFEGKYLRASYRAVEN